MILECFFVMNEDEDAVFENLFIVLQAHCHCDTYECKILNVSYND